MKSFKEYLEESFASNAAHRLGLHYLGFGKWGRGEKAEFETHAAVLRKIPDKRIYDYLTDATNLEEALDAIKNLPQASKEARVIIGALLKTSNVKECKFKLGNHKNYTGEYSPSDHEVSIYQDASLYTIIHESVHAVTVHNLDMHIEHVLDKKGYKIPVGKTEVGKQLVDLYQQAKDYVVAKKWNVQAHYGFTDIYEFVAEAFSDETFQELLTTIPSKGAVKKKPKSLFKKFVESISSMLKIPSESKTLFGDIISLSSTKFFNSTSKKENNATN